MVDRLLLAPGADGSKNGNQPENGSNPRNAERGHVHFIQHQYGGQQRVAREVRDGGGRSYTFDYTASEHSEAYDHWKIRTVSWSSDFSSMQSGSNG